MCCINITVWQPEILCRNRGMPFLLKNPYSLKTSISLVELVCSLQKNPFSLKKSNVLLFKIYKSISHTCKRKFQDCSSSHISIASWRHILDYIIRLIIKISNSEIVVKIAEVNSLFLYVVTCICHGMFFSYQNKNLICYDSICLQVDTNHATVS